MCRLQSKMAIFSPSVSWALTASLIRSQTPSLSLPISTTRPTPHMLRTLHVFCTSYPILPLSKTLLPPLTLPALQCDCHANGGWFSCHYCSVFILFCRVLRHSHTLRYSTPAMGCLMFNATVMQEKSLRCAA